MKKVWLLIVPISLMIIIFILSSMPYEQQHIKPYLKETISLKDTPSFQFTYDGHVVSTAEPYDFIEFFIRKAGHVLGYFVLTIIWLVVLSRLISSVKSVVFLSFILSAGYAGLDEFHQSFTPGRTGHFIDVLAVDLPGVILAILTFCLVRWKKSGR
jgi:VanZ family protein